MKRTNNPKITIFIFLFLSFTLFACSLSTENKGSLTQDTVLDVAQTPTLEISIDEILAKSAEAMKSVDTMGVNMTVITSSSGVSLEVIMEGVVESPNHAYLKINLYGQNIELLMKNETEIFIKQPGSTGWEAVPLDQLSSVNGLSQLGGVNYDVLEFLDIIHFAKNMVLLPSEKIGEVDCFLINFDVDINTYLSQMGEIYNNIDIDSASGKGSLWIGKNDFLTRQLSFDLKALIQGVSINPSTTLVISNFNQPVNFPSP